MQSTNKPNQTTQELDELRKKSLADSFGKRGKKPQEQESSQKEQTSTQENVEKDEKKLDIDEKNSYIDTKNTSESEIDEEVDKYKRIFEQQFGSDGVKAVKTWSQTQSEYMKLRNQFKDNEAKLKELDSLLKKHPKLANALESAYNNGSFEDIELEPESKPANKSQSKPANVTAVDENILAETGYLDKKQKEFLDDTQWNVLVRQANLEYMMNELPKTIAEKAVEETRKRTDEVQKQQQEESLRQQNQQTIVNRYNQGIENVIREYGLDFVNNEEHKQLLDEIDDLVVGFRDPKNPKVIREDAVEIAAKYLLDSRGISVNKQETPDKEQLEKETFESSGFNVNNRPNRNERSNKPLTVADKLRQRRIDEYERQLQFRQTERKNN